MKKVCAAFTACVLLIVGVVCAENKESTKKEIKAKSEVEMKLTSEAFKEGEFIPKKYSCEDADISPALEIAGIPEGTKSLALICDDPDAPVGLWVHWVAYNIPPDATILPEGIAKDMQTMLGDDSSATITQGINSWGKFGYGGPCPPPGKPHRYFFKLYALDNVLNIDDGTVQKGINNEGLLKLMDGHILAETSLMGKYKR